MCLTCVRGSMARMAGQQELKYHSKSGIDYEFEINYHIRSVCDVSATVQMEI